MNLVTFYYSKYSSLSTSIVI